MPKGLALVGFLAVLFSFALFGNGIGGDFVLDDTIVIVGNPFVGNHLEEFWNIFATPYFAYQPLPGLYRPLVIASYSINAFLFGSSPVSFHVVNILLHAATSFLFFVLLYRLSVSRIAAFTGFLFFMFFPIHVEAVTSIVGRAEILSLLFVIGALLFVIKQRYFLASLLFFLALLSKEMAVAFLPIFLFLEFKWHKKGAKAVIGSFWCFIPSVVLYAILRYAALGKYFLSNDATPIYNPIKFASLFSGLWTSFKVFYFYFEKTFFPLSLSSDYSFNQIPLVDNLLISVPAILGIVVLALLILLFFKTNNFVFRFGIIIFLSSYFVISNWIFKTGTIMAERLMYMPSMGLAIIPAIVAQNLKLKAQNYGPKFKRLFLVFCLAFCVLLVWYGYLIIDRNRDWLSEKALHESAYAAAPDSIVNQTNMAYLDFIEGRYNKAGDRLNNILNTAPEHVPALNLAGQNFKKLGQYQKSEELWKRAIELRKDYLRAYLSLGVLYYENGYFESAENVLTDAINIYPRWSEILFLALAKVGLNKPEQAIELITKYFSGDPAQKQLKFALGWAYLNKGDRVSAYKYFNQIKDSQISTDDFVKTFEGSKVIILGEF